MSPNMLRQLRHTGSLTRIGLVQESDDSHFRKPLFRVQSVDFRPTATSLDKGGGPVLLRQMSVFLTSAAANNKPLTRNGMQLIDLSIIYYSGTLSALVLAQRPIKPMVSAIRHLNRS